MSDLITFYQLCRKFATQKTSFDKIRSVCLLYDKIPVNISINRLSQEVRVLDIKAIVHNYYNKFKREFLKWIGPKRRDFLYYKLWPYYYKKYSKKPIDPQKVVLAYSHLYKKMPDNLSCIKEYLEVRGYKCVVIDRAEHAVMSKNWFLNEIFKCFYGRKFFKAYGNAKALFLTDYFFPAFACKPREGQRVVQLWHGCGAFKKWGYSTAEKKWGASKKELDRYPIHNTYTHVCVSSPEVSFAYAEAFGCSEDVVIPLGAPRTDVYFDSDFVSSGRKKLLEMFPEIGERKIILYAPTFRGNSVGKSYIKNMLKLDEMYDELSKDYVLVIKQHPLTASAFKLSEAQLKTYGDFVFDVSKTVEIDTAFCAADLVITDYSSLIFEYALLERPMIFYAYDLASYEDARSFYFEYENFVPGEIVTDTRGIIDEVKRLETEFDVEKICKFKNNFMSACDGSSTERIIEAVLK